MYHLPRLGRIGCLCQGLAQIRVAEHLGDFTQQMKMVFVGMLRYQQGKCHVDVLSVGGIEGNVTQDAYEGT